MNPHARTAFQNRPGGKPSRGFSLVELVIAIVVTGIIILAITPFLRLNLMSYVTVQSGKKNMDMARIGFNRMVSELKRIQNPNTIEGYLSGTTITYTGTFYKNDVWYSRNLRLTYDPSAQTVTRNDLDRSSGDIVLVNNITAFQLEYFDRDDAIATEAKKVWRMRLSMTAGTGANAVTFIQEIHPKILPFLK